ncbi:MAG: TolC family protein, partial [Candidatus Omnitrophota bacterium]
MVYRNIIRMVLVTVMLFDPAFSYSAEPVSLNALIDEALKNNPQIQAAQRRWEASQARVPQAKSLDNPTIGITFEKIPRGTVKLNKTMPEDRMLTLSQFLPFFGKIKLKGKIALIESQMVAAEYKNTELEIINQLKTAYYDLFMNAKEIEFLTESLKLLEGIAAVSESRYAVGDMRQEAVYKIHSEIA